MVTEADFLFMIQPMNQLLNAPLSHHRCTHLVHTTATPYSAHYTQCTSKPQKADVTAQYVTGSL